VLSDSRPTNPRAGQRVAQNFPREPRGGSRRGDGRFSDATPGQQARLAASEAQARAAIRRVQQLDPAWRPTPSLTETIEGEIAANEAIAREADAREHKLRSVGIGPGPFACESIPARGTGRNYTSEERASINEIGRARGCHTCGKTNPGTGSGNFVPDLSSRAHSCRLARLSGCIRNASPAATGKEAGPVSSGASNPDD
jgi:hypothetical protein